MDSTTEATSDAAAPHDPLAGVPELQTYVAEKEEDKIAALKLVADSVAQMAQAANSSVIWHPLTLAVLIAIIAVVAQVVLRSTGQIGTAATTCTGLIMILLVLCRRISAPYVVEAEGINFEWLGEAQMIVTKFGDEIMGTVVIDWISPDSKQKKKKVQKGEIKGWAVRMRYRGKGVGSALLEEAVKESQKKGAETIEFAADHASEYCDLRQYFVALADFRRRCDTSLPQDLQRQVRQEREEGPGAPARPRRIRILT